MSSKAMSLKARIRNLAKRKNIAPQILLQNYMFERFLDRLSKSAYQDKFILKGGMLIAAIVGLGKRSTMDLDTTLRRLPLSEGSLRSSLNEICAMPVDDGVKFTTGAINPIRADDIYGGYRVSLAAKFETIETPLSIDVSAGDVITPRAVKFSLYSIFDEKRQIELWAYNIETVMAEKVETILSRSILNTRPRDFYDIYILATTQGFDESLLREAIAATAAHRGSTENIADKKGLIDRISESSELRRMWTKYQRQFDYAVGISYEQVIEILRKLCL
ncbi:MAG: nucleotidyl transferase AbiEii/AbiGii toxin family protein [Synergistaceae bacterium]|nr:nucleotidyl transferase AbiEii/AbiGii toxin family protein [Synergistaceae bacterium]